MSSDRPHATHSGGSNGAIEPPSVPSAMHVAQVARQDKTLAYIGCNHSFRTEETDVTAKTRD